MNKVEFAELINGCEYRNELTKEQEQLAKENGLVVVFGASDDLMEFRGAIYEETGAWDGGKAMIVKKKGGKIDVLSESDYEEVQGLIDDKELDLQINFVEVIAEWCPKELPNTSWLMKTDLPHATFDVMEDGELYCRGIVIERYEIESHM